MNIQIGGKPHIDGEIDNPEFYYQAMDIIDKFHTDHNRAMMEIEEEKERLRKLNQPNISIWMYVFVILIWLVLMVRG